jgi:transposase-like protein
MVSLLTNIFFLLVQCLLSHQLNREKTSHPTAALPPCPNCGSHHTIKNGSNHNGKPKRQYKECGQPFVINPTNKTISPDTKQLIDQLLLERMSLRGIARVTGVSWSWLQNYVNNKLAAVPRQIRVSEKPKGKLIIECDEMWSFVYCKKIKVYIWQLIDIITTEIIDCYLGYRSCQSVKKWASLPDIYRKCAVTYTDFWKSYRTVISS